jgi:hypothetical protein
MASALSPVSADSSAHPHDRKPLLMNNMSRTFQGSTNTIEGEKDTEDF